MECGNLFWKEFPTERSRSVARLAVCGVHRTGFFGENKDVELERRMAVADAARFNPASVPLLGKKLRIKQEIH